MSSLSDKLVACCDHPSGFDDLLRAFEAADGESRQALLAEAQALFAQGRLPIQLLGELEYAQEQLDGAGQTAEPGSEDDADCRTVVASKAPLADADPAPQQSQPVQSRGEQSPTEQSPAAEQPPAERPQPDRMHAHQPVPDPAAAAAAGDAATEAQSSAQKPDPPEPAGALTDGASADAAGATAEAAGAPAPVDGDATPPETSSGGIPAAEGDEGLTVVVPQARPRPRTQQPAAADADQPREVDSTQSAADMAASATAAMDTVGTGTGTGTGAGFGTTGTAGTSGTYGSATTRRDFQPSPDEPEVGALLRNRFMLEEVLGRGGMGVVFKARDLSKEEVSFSRDEKNYVAIKLLNESFKQNPDSIKALGREFSNTQELNHPNVINLYDFDKDEHGNYFIAMELLAGQPLNDYIRRLRKSGGLPYEEAYALIKQMGDALAAAHNHTPPIIHSDFKPGNVFIGEDGRIKVFDFGIARAAQHVEGADHERTNFDAGTLGALTPAYASLEMLAGLTPDKRDDIYALAIVCYELLAGQRPFGRKTTAQQAMAQKLEPPRIRSLTSRQWRGLRRGLAFERDKRSDSIEQFLAELGPTPSRLPLYIAAGIASIAGAGAAAWYLGVAPYLDTQREAELLAELTQLDAAVALPPLLARAEQLSDDSRRRVQRSAAASLVRLANAGQDPAVLAGLIAYAADLPREDQLAVTDAVVTRLAAEIAGADDARRKAALAALAELPPTTATTTRDKAARDLAASLQSASPEEVLARLPVVEDLPAAIKRDVTIDAKDVLLDALLAGVRRAFDPQAGNLDRAGAQALIERAERLFPDSLLVRDGETELDKRFDDFVLRLDDRLNRLNAEGALLAAPEAAATDSIPGILGILSRLDAERYPAEYAYLANSYYSAAKNAEAEDLDLAEAYVETGLALFPDAVELKNQRARIEQLAALEAQQATLAELRERVQTGLPALAADLPDTAMLKDLQALRRLAPDDPLLATAKARLETQIEAELAPLLSTQDWAAAEATVQRYADLLDAATVAAQNTAIETARAAQAARLAEAVQAVTERIQAGDLPGADAALAALTELAPDGPEVAQARADLVRGYLGAARKARLAGAWDQARELVAAGFERTDDRQIKLSFQDELAAIDRGQDAAEQAMAAAERERLEAERRERITAIKRGFSDFVTAMDATEADAIEARGFLDRLAGLAPDDGLLATGPAQIAQRFIDAADALAAAGRWQDAIARIETGQRLQPGSVLLAEALTALQARYADVQAEQRLAALAAQEQQLDTLLDSPAFTPDWSRQVRAALEALTALGDAGGVDAIAQRLNGLYQERIAQQRDASEFNAARALLEQWEELVPDAIAQQARTRKSVDAALVAWEQAADERRRQAEIDARMQSLRTQAQADQPEQALATLEELRGRLDTDNPFVTTEAPRLIADAYVRLAEESRERGVLDTALALLDKAQNISPQAKLDELRAQIELEAERDRISAALARASADELPDLADAVQQLRDRAEAAQIATWTEQWAATLVRRIERASSPASGQALQDAALALFPAAEQLRRAQVPQPVASQTLADARTALNDHRLTAAAELLAKARRETPAHPLLSEVAQDLEAGQSAATAAYQVYRSAIGRAQFAKANKALETACRGWADHPEWCASRPAGTVVASSGKTSAAAQPVAAQPVTQDVCNPRFAGYGRSAKARCWDTLEGGERGPMLVVIPAGAGSNEPFAISRYEISIGDYNLYCRRTNECRPIPGDSKLPVTSITKAQADAYAAWLSRISGARYRLPYDSEWEFAARARNRPPSGTANCLIRSGGNIIKGGKPEIVSAGPQNSWGLVNHIGNVQEWTIDGSALRARGGYFGDDDQNCGASLLLRSHNGAADTATGFRIVREIKG